MDDSRVLINLASKEYSKCIERYLRADDRYITFLPEPFYDCNGDNQMNYENLHELINRYEQSIDYLYGTEHYELFKWEAVKTWRDEWFKPESAFSSFGERFSAARKGLGWFMDNSRMHPSSGVLKLWEKEPDTVEGLFDALFSETRDVHALQEKMDLFIEEYEALRQRYFPGNWSFKHDRHSVSIFLAMNDPYFNYVFG